MVLFVHQGFILEKIHLLDPLIAVLLVGPMVVLKAFHIAIGLKKSLLVLGVQDLGAFARAELRLRWTRIGGLL
jgi:uncharacterized membrane protein YGL010W